MELDTGMIQMMIITSFAAVQATDAPVLISRGHAQLNTYPSVYINTVKEGGLSLPSSCERGATAPLAHPHSYALATYQW